ncbi:MAG: GxGYxYP family putative glycoside hydrolase [Phycisphaerae bacterium]|nr:GxGYxYP family putative glycoside hydrolase [Phycisphaerae bacterium]
MNQKNIFAAILLTVLVLNTHIFAIDKIYTYDLRGTLKVNLDEPNQVNDMWDTCHAVATLQGLVNRNAPQLYLIYVDSQHRPENVDQYWLDKCSQKGQWLYEVPKEEIKSFESLLETFKKFVNGVVVYDPLVPATSNVASAVAGAEGLIAVRYDKRAGSVYDILVNKMKLPKKVSFVQEDGSSIFKADGKIPGTQRYTTNSPKCDAYIWMKIHYLDKGKLDPRVGAYYIDYYWTKKPRRTVTNHHTLTNHDFFVSKKAWFFDLDPWADEAANDEPDQIPGLDRRTLQELLLSAYKQLGGKEMIYVGGFVPWAHKYTQFAGCRHPDVSTEWEYSALLSAYNAFMDADAIAYGAMANASFWQHYPLKPNYPQKWVTDEELKTRGYLSDDGQVNFDGRQFLIFYVGDYDSSAWVYQRTMDLWDDPNRGKVPMMWCFSPALSARAPMVMDYVRSTAAEKDYFAAADNGAGYLNPGMLQYLHYLPLERPISGLPSGIEVWKQHCKKNYDKWGLTITGFIIDGFAQGLSKTELDCYEAFSPNGIIWVKGSYSYLHNNMPVLRSDWDVNNENPADAAKAITQRVKERPLPFHWFRNILKTPSWYVQVVEELNKANPKIELLDAPTFFELYRIYLKSNPDAAAGKYPYFP